jgi:hypothetical protein
VERQSVEAMTDSQTAAKQAALTRLGYDVTVTGDGARILEVVRDSPADEAGLRPGDVITEIDGEPIMVRDQVGEIVQSQPVGTTFAVAIWRPNADDRVVEVTSGTAESGAIEGRPYFGIGAATAGLAVELPVEVDIDAGEVSGPSGGLSFALTIIDELSPGDLTGGADVAVTGEIDGDTSFLSQKEPAERTFRFNHEFHLQMGNVAPLLAAAIESGKYLGKPGDMLGRLNTDNACTACHRGLEETDVAAKANLPQMSDCLVCHSDIRNPFSCEKCHLEGVNLMPADHTRNFVDTHSTGRLGLDKTTCLPCHGRNFACMGCH